MEIEKDHAQVEEPDKWREDIDYLKRERVIALFKMKARELKNGKFFVLPKSKSPHATIELRWDRKKDPYSKCDVFNWVSCSVVRDKNGEIADLNFIPRVSIPPNINIDITDKVRRFLDASVKDPVQRFI